MNSNYFAAGLTASQVGLPDSTWIQTNVSKGMTEGNVYVGYIIGILLIFWIFKAFQRG